MTNDKLHVLAVPAGYLISDITGTDAKVSYEILYHLSRLFNVNFQAIVNFAKIEKPLPSNVKLYRLNVKFGGGVFEQTTFIYKYFKRSLEILKKEKISILHHILPFGYRTTFNPVAISNKDYPFVIGPVQCPHTAFFRDDNLLMWGRMWSESRPISALEEIGIERYLLDATLRTLKPTQIQLFEKTLENCDILIAVNKAAKQLYKEYVESEKISIIPLGVNLEEFKFSPVPETYDILALGGHFERKGFNYLIEAMPNVLKEAPKAKLHLLGAGPQTENLKKLTKKLHLEENVIFHGFVPRSEVPKFYAKCRVLCHPSLSEAYENVTLEAMASGRPCVATNTIGSREKVVDGKTGFLVPVADSRSIADALIKILSDYELAKKMGAEGRRFAGDIYDWKVIARHYYEAYREVLK